MRTLTSRRMNQTASRWTAALALAGGLFLSPDAGWGGEVGALWGGFGGTPQHTATSTVAAQSLDRIRWQTPVDLRPQYSGNDLLIHYGSPLVTTANTVIVPVKVGAAGRFRVEARRGADSTLL